MTISPLLPTRVKKPAPAGLAERWAISEDFTLFDSLGQVGICTRPTGDAEHDEPAVPAEADAKLRQVIAEARAAIATDTNA